MNTRLEQLFEEYNVSEKDRYEITQIFSLLPLDKQKNLLNNFSALAFRLEQINKEIALERRILVWDLFEDIKSFYNRFWDRVWNI